MQVHVGRELQPPQDQQSAEALLTERFNDVLNSLPVEAVCTTEIRDHPKDSPLALVIEVTFNWP